MILKFKPRWKVEEVESCKLVQMEYTENGHDCWGNFDWITHYYVMINNNKRDVFKGWYIVHDGKVVKDVWSEWMKNYKLHGK